MRTRRLVALALPLAALGGCGRQQGRFPTRVNAEHFVRVSVGRQCHRRVQHVRCAPAAGGWNCTYAGPGASGSMTLETQQRDYPTLQVIC